MAYAIDTNGGLFSDLFTLCNNVNANRGQYQIRSDWVMQTDCAYYQINATKTTVLAMSQTQFQTTFLPYWGSKASSASFRAKYINQAALLLWATSTGHTANVGVFNGFYNNINTPVEMVTWVCPAFSAGSSADVLSESNIISGVIDPWEAILSKSSVHAKSAGINLLAGSEHFKSPLFEAQVQSSLLYGCIASIVGFVALVVLFTQNLSLTIICSLSMFTICVITVALKLAISSQVFDFYDIVLLVTLFGVMTQFLVYYMFHFFNDSDHLKLMYYKTADFEDDFDLLWNVPNSLILTTRYSLQSFIYPLVMLIACGGCLLTSDFWLVFRAGQYLIIMSLVSFIYTLCLLPFLLGLAYRFQGFDYDWDANEYKLRQYLYGKFRYCYEYLSMCACCLSCYYKHFKKPTPVPELHDIEQGVARSENGSAVASQRASTSRRNSFSAESAFAVSTRSQQSEVAPSTKDPATTEQPAIESSDPKPSAKSTGEDLVITSSKSKHEKRADSHHGASRKLQKKYISKDGDTEVLELNEENLRLLSDQSQGELGLCMNAFIQPHAARRPSITKERFVPEENPATSKSSRARILARFQEYSAESDAIFAETGPTKPKANGRLLQFMEAAATALRKPLPTKTDMAYYQKTLVSREIIQKHEDIEQNIATSAKGFNSTLSVPPYRPEESKDEEVSESTKIMRRFEASFFGSPVDLAVVAPVAESRPPSASAEVRESFFKLHRSQDSHDSSRNSWKLMRLFENSFLSSSKRSISPRNEVSPRGEKKEEVPTSAARAPAPVPAISDKTAVEPEEHKVEALDDKQATDPAEIAEVTSALETALAEVEARLSSASPSMDMSCPEAGEEPIEAATANTESSQKVNTQASSEQVEAVDVAHTDHHEAMLDEDAPLSGRIVKEAEDQFATGEPADHDHEHNHVEEGEEVHDEGEAKANDDHDDEGGEEEEENKSETGPSAVEGQDGQAAPQKRKKKRKSKKSKK